MIKFTKIIILFNALFIAYATAISTSPNIRIGLSTQNPECIVSMDGGGEVQDLDGKKLFTLKHGEKLRIWLDNNNKSVNNSDEFSIQVGPPTTTEQADAIIKQLKTLNIPEGEKIAVSDGGSWRVLIGHYKSSKDVVPILNQMYSMGYKELWIVTEPCKVNCLCTPTLYAVTDCYERRCLPNKGIRLVSVQNLITVSNKGRYCGVIEIFPNFNGSISIVNELNLEAYLRGVVPMEMSGGNFPEIEALKAQAVAARTYAFANLGKRAKNGFDLYDTTLDQVYGGYDKEQELTNRAVLETSNIIATYNGLPIQALFMANAGSATVDNSFVFGNAYPYLVGVSNYAKMPQTIAVTSKLKSCHDVRITWELLRLVGNGSVPSTLLKASHMKASATTSDLLPIIKAVAKKLNQLHTITSNTQGSHIFLWIARSLGFHEVVDGIEQPQDAVYLLGKSIPLVQDQPLATFLTRKGLVSPNDWNNKAPTLSQALNLLGKLWYELDPVEFSQGTLLRNGKIRLKNGTFTTVNLTNFDVLVEEAPGGHIRLVDKSNIQVGDTIKWLANPGGSLVLVHCLNSNGTALNRYNSTAHWKTEIKESDLLESLYTKAGIKDLNNIILTHNSQGRVIELNIVDSLGHSHRFTGMRIRSLLGLKDNLFRFITIGDKPKRRWIVYGRGWGHGVGMDQTGAYGMALEGANFKEILEYYYKGIQLKSIEELKNQVL